jgi:hypothetical protein
MDSSDGRSAPLPTLQEPVLEQAEEAGGSMSVQLSLLPMLRRAGEHG